jgi:hypothetical protein
MFQEIIDNLSNKPEHYYMTDEVLDIIRNRRALSRILHGYYEYAIWDKINQQWLVKTTKGVIEQYRSDTKSQLYNASYLLNKTNVHPF